jgi:diguanylate cyclase (GGDEF)-like protein
VAARSDRLTGLPGPSVLSELLAGEAPLALLLVDLDAFHVVNLDHGFAAGDAALVAAAAALGELARSEDVGAHVARTSADEFALVAPCRSEPQALELGARAVAAVAASGAGVTASCGAILVEGSRTGAAEVRSAVQRAGLALQNARRAGRGSVAGQPEGRAELSTAEQDDLDVRTALRLGDYELHFQPLLEPATEDAVGLEALVRWRRDELGLVAPGTFLPQVRRSGLAAEFGAGVLARALEAWADELRDAVSAAPEGGRRTADPVELDGAATALRPLIAVNVDAEQAAQTGFDALVLHLLTRNGVASEQLVLEVTESVLAEAATVARLQRLRAAGVRVAIDDFGAGPVVLSEIRELPVDIVKVDQVLVGRLDALVPDVSLIEDLRQLTRLLGLRLTVEAVETPALAQRVAELGIDLVQGYHYGRPMPRDGVVAWLQGQRTAAVAAGA